MKFVCFVPFDSQRGWQAVAVVAILTCWSVAFDERSLAKTFNLNFKWQKIFTKIDSLTISIEAGMPLQLSSLSNCNKILVNKNQAVY